MSKSVGNFISITAFKAKHKDQDLLKLIFLMSQYRHPVDYTNDKIEQARKAKERIAIFLQKADEALEGHESKAAKACEHEAAFTEAMDDDFNTSLALSAIFKCVEAGNKILGKKELKGADADRLDSSRSFIRKASKGLFALDLEYKKVEDKAVLKKISAREEARKNKDFALADKIRQELADEGIILEDSKEGSKWRRRS